MTGFNNIGFDVKYPPGCKELQDGLKPDELKKRLADLMKVLEEFIPESHDSMLNESIPVDSVDNLLAPENQKKSIEEYRGLAYVLSSQFLLDNGDKDVQIQTGVCLCFLIRYFCPNNIFESFTDSKSIINTVLNFFLKCIDEISKCKSKSDKYFLNIFKILTICCNIDIFHWHTLLEDDGETLLVNCFKVMFSVIRRLNDLSQDADCREAIKTIIDTLANLILSCDPSNNLPDKIVQLLLNYLVDRSVIKCQKEIAVELITRCSSKLEDQIQSLLQSFLLQDDNAHNEAEQNEENTASDQSDDDAENIAVKNDEENEEEISSYDLYLKQKRAKRVQPTAIKPNYSGHTFQLLYELFKINESIIAPILPMLDVKLKSVSCTDRKRACRLLGKLFAGTVDNNSVKNNNKSTGLNCSYRNNLWDGLLGRFMDIETEVREVCIRVARDLLLLDPNIHLGLAREDLARALDKRSHDQDDNIRLQVVLAVLDILQKSMGIMATNDEMPVVEEILLATLIDRSRDRSLDTRKSAYTFLGKLYRSIVECEDQITLKLTPKLRARAELLLNKILRLYQRVDVHDRIIVERLFNTCIVPYQLGVSHRVNYMMYCFVLANDAWLKSISELLKTQRMALQELRHIIQILAELEHKSASGGDATTKSHTIPTDISLKLRDAVRILAEYLPGKDRVDNLTKLFNIALHDRKLLDQLRVFVNTDSPRAVILKAISEIKRLINASDSHHSATNQAQTNPSVGGANSQKKKSLVASVKHLLERTAPIIIDKDFCQETISHLISSSELQTNIDSTNQLSIELPRALLLLQMLTSIFQHTIPLNEIYEYLINVMQQFQQKKIIEVHASLSEDVSSTPGSIAGAKSNNIVPANASSKLQFNPTTEELALSILSRILPIEEPKMSGKQSSQSSSCILLDENTQSQINEANVELTHAILPYLESCMLHGGSQTQVVYDSSVVSTANNKFCQWKYRCKITKVATKCLVGLLNACKLVETQLCANQPPQQHTLLNQLESYLQQSFLVIVQKTILEHGYEENPALLNALTQVGLNYPGRFGGDIKKFVESTLFPMLKSQDTLDSPSQEMVKDEELSITDQIKEQSLKLLGKWLPSLSVQSDCDLVNQSMKLLQQIIIQIDICPPRLRLAAGCCWLKLAQNQSFLPLLDVSGLYCLPPLLINPCRQLRHHFIYQLNKGLFRLKLPLDYMALLSLCPLQSKDDEFLATARSSLITNIARRREFLERRPQYLKDAKLLFAILPDYVLAFVVHMLAHQSQLWDNCNDDNDSILIEVKSCLWFVMEPLIKQGENYSFIRKILERIKHALDATVHAQNNPDLDGSDGGKQGNTLSNRLHIIADIALGLLLTKQTNPIMKDYPVEVRLPRTRYIPAPNDFINPDFADLFVESESGNNNNNNNRVRIQFTPPPRNKANIKLLVPPELIKGFQQKDLSGKIPLITKNNNHSTTEGGILKTSGQNEENQVRKRKAKVVIVVPDLEGTTTLTPANNNNNGVLLDSPLMPQFTTKKVSVRIKTPGAKRKRESGLSSDVSFPAPLPDKMQISKHGRICRPNNLVMKDMVSPNKISILNVADEENGGTVRQGDYNEYDEEDDEDAISNKKSPNKKKSRRGAKRNRNNLNRMKKAITSDVSVSLERLSDDQSTLVMSENNRKRQSNEPLDELIEETDGENDEEETEMSSGSVKVNKPRGRKSLRQQHIKQTKEDKKLTVKKIKKDTSESEKDVVVESEDKKTARGRKKKVVEKEVVKEPEIIKTGRGRKKKELSESDKEEVVKEPEIKKAKIRNSKENLISNKKTPVQTKESPRSLSNSKKKIKEQDKTMELVEEGKENSESKSIRGRKESNKLKVVGIRGRPARLSSSKMVNGSSSKSTKTNVRISARSSKQLFDNSDIYSFNSNDNSPIKPLSSSTPDRSTPKVKSRRSNPTLNRPVFTTPSSTTKRSTSTTVNSTPKTPKTSTTKASSSNTLSSSISSRSKRSASQIATINLLK